MTSNRFTRGRTAARASVRLLAGFIVMLALLFLPAGTWAWREAWAYLAVVFMPVMLILAWLLASDPELLERRMRTKEKRPEQKCIVRMGSIVYVSAFLISGLDRRFGWSHVPAAAVVAADALMLLGYALFALVLRENKHASRLIEVEPGQRVVTTGPYAIVRHPMYLAALLMFLCTPPALGSWWGMLAVPPLIAVLAARIRNEEQLLAKELEGYSEYARVTRRRLIPGVW